MDKQQLQKVLIPAAAIAGVILLVGLIVATGSTTEVAQNSDKKGGGSSSPSSPVLPGNFEVFPLDGPEWKEFPSKVKYWDVKEGSGFPVAPGAVVTMHYTLWLTNGKKVQSSKDSNKPFSSPLTNLIAGWQEGIPGMKPGGVRRLVIPADKGYGNSNKGDIPPNSTLIFEVELISSP